MSLTSLGHSADASTPVAAATCLRSFSTCAVSSVLPPPQAVTVRAGAIRNSSGTVRFMRVPLRPGSKGAAAGNSPNAPRHLCYVSVRGIQQELAAGLSALQVLVGAHRLG